VAARDLPVMDAGCGPGHVTAYLAAAGADAQGIDLSPEMIVEAHRLAGVSQKMLTQTLRSLERDGLLIRTVTPTVPVTVTYELTDLGLSLQQLMRGVKAWAEAHMDEVLANREKYDNRVA
jgi:DNA-binding PadR family transcriptional regulator